MNDNEPKVNPWLIALTVMLPTFMEVLDTTIANVSLTHIAGSLAASQDESTWILTSYLVSNSIILPISGWLADVIGRKRFYQLCVVLFTLSSVLCAASTTLNMMIFARILQGLGGGGLAPITQSMLADSFPPSKRPQAFALFGLTVIAAPATGPIIGGWLTDHLSWHWVFLINLPVGLMAATLIGVFVAEPAVLIEERRARLGAGIRFDYFGLALVAVGFGCLQIFLDKFQQDDGFSSSFIVTLAAIAFVALSTLAVWEWQHPEPVMNVRLFRYRNFAISNVVMFLIGFTLLSSTQLLPQMSETLLGYDSETAGLALAIGAIATIGLMPVAGFVTGRLIPAKYLLMAGFAETGLALLLLTRIAPDVDFDTLAVARLLQVVALPFLFIPISALSYVGVPPELNGQASALSNQVRNVGGSVGISFVTTMLAWRTQFHHARLAASISPYGSLHHQPLSVIAGIVQTQSAFLAYLDLFHILGVIVFLVFPVLFFVGEAPRDSAAGAPHGL
jgi:MFS transporter, DHA2 family, multidrug resistance protein